MVLTRVKWPNVALPVPAQWAGPSSVVDKGVAYPGRSGDGAVGSARERAEAGAAEDHYLVGSGEARASLQVAKVDRLSNENCHGWKEWAPLFFSGARRFFQATDSLAPVVL